MLAGVEAVLATAARMRRDRLMGQVSLFGNGSIEVGDDPATDTATTEELSDAGGSLPVVREFSQEEALRFEKELLGVYLSDHPLTAVAEQMRRQGALSSEELKEQGDRQEVVVGGIVLAVVPRTTKKGQPMASVTLEDLTGSIPVTVFPKAYEEYGRYLEKERILLVKGKTSIREPLGASARAEGADRDEDEAPGIVEVHADEIIPFQAAAAVMMHEPAVHVRLTRVRPGQLTLLRTMVCSYPGSVVLFFHVATAAHEERIMSRLTVAASPKLIEALQSIVGRGEAWLE
jgi:DNA polymerase-3 subunit alpha